MFRLRRFYLDSIGVPENRFSDLMLDLTGLDGEPADSIVWLRNGAGKTTMLSLLLALILPARRDFLATRTKKRTLEDLVQGGDTAHVVAEWVDPTGHVLLTGAVYEWDGRVRPRDYNEGGKAKLRRSFWCVDPDPAVEGSTLDDLPFTLRTSGRYDRDRFRGHVRDLAATGVNAVVADQTLGEWHTALRERRFDPDLFRYFAEVNAAEGGIDGLFSGIDSPGAFVRYLLRFVADPQRSAPVRDLLAQTAVEIAKRPVYEAERDFCSDASPRVRALGDAHTAVLAAGADLDEVRRRAGAFKAALRASEEAALQAKGIAEQRCRDLDDALTGLRNSVEGARRRRDHFRRVAVDLLVSTSRVAADRAGETAQRAESDVAAWTAVEELVALQVAQAELDAHKAALEGAAEGALPLVERLEMAKSSLAAALVAEVRGAESVLATDRRVLDEQKREVERAGTDERTAYRALADLTSELHLTDQRISDFVRDHQALVDADVFGAREPLKDAAERLRHAVDGGRVEVERMQAECVYVAAELAGAEGELTAARTAAGRAAADHRVAAAEVRRIRARATELGDRPRLRELLQSNAVDLTTQAGDAVEALTRAVTAMDVESVDMRARAAADERAISALAADGLLPPRPEVARVLELLRAAGTTAHPGWRYLAEHVPLAEHTRHIAEQPEVVDGVIVYGDPHAASARLDDGIDEVVVIAQASTLSERREPRVVVGPAAARHDHDAAAAELERRKSRYTELTTAAAKLARNRETDATSHAEIRAFVAELPDGGIRELEGRRTAAAEAQRIADEAESTAVAAHGRLRTRLDELQQALGELRTALGRSEAQLPRVTALAVLERDVIEPLRVRKAAIPGEQDRRRAQEADARERLRRATAEVTALETAIAVLDGRRQQWQSRLQALPAPADGLPASLEAAEAAVDVAAEQLRENFPEYELRAAVRRGEEMVQRRAQPWQARTRPVQKRAEGLAAGPAGADLTSRIAAVADARSRSAAANQAQGEAGAVLRAAEQAQEGTPPGRLRATDDVVAARDRDHALILMGEAEDQAAAGQHQVGRTERDREGADRDVGDAAGRAGMLNDQIGLLRHVPDAEPNGAVPDDAAATRAAVLRLTDALDSRQSTFDTAESVRRDAVERLRRWAADDRFAGVADDEHGQAVRRLREMFTGELVVERVAPRAEDLVVDLDVRRRAIQQQLAQVETHKRNVVVRLTDLVDDALGLLGRASRLSELPAGIGPWEHRPFLTVEARKRPAREQVELRVGELVDRMVRGKKIEMDADELLWRATEAAVVDGFTATVLKPAPDQPTGRTPVDQMQKWSGGENLTASLVLFCVLARLRAEQRTGTRGGSAGGVVPLDNPLGKANYLPFLDLQRRVARANGVQLVFWTGIGDLGAVTAFPRIAAMHKRASTTRPGRSYVQVDEEHTQTLDAVSSVRRDD